MKQDAFTLIELILFIVIIGVLGSSIFISINYVLLHSRNHNDDITALQLASERMELIIGNQYDHSNTPPLDPCQHNKSTACHPLKNFSIKTSITQSQNNLWAVKVDVFGKGKASLLTQLAVTS